MFGVKVHDFRERHITHYEATELYVTVVFTRLVSMLNATRVVLEVVWENCYVGKHFALTGTRTPDDVIGVGTIIAALEEYHCILIEFGILDNVSHAVRVSL